MDSSPARPTRAQLRRRTRLRAVLVLGVVVIVLAGGGVAFAMTRSTGPSYRVATVTRATVSQTVDTVGTISTVNQATLAFPVSGQVAAVRVAVGDTVTAGQTLATLNTTSLTQTVSSQNAAVASAQQTLVTDEAAQTGTSTATAVTQAALAGSGAVRAETDGIVLLAATSPAPGKPSGSADHAAPSGTTPSGTTPSGTGHAPGSSTAPSLSSATAAVKAAQTQVVADQKKYDLDSDVEAADKAVVAETAACQAILDQSGSTGSTPPAGASNTSTPTSATTSAPATAASSANPASSNPGSTSSDLQACQNAITVVEQAPRAVQTDEDTLSADETALTKAVTQLLTAVSVAGTGVSGAPSGATSGVQRQGSGKTATASGSTSAAGEAAGRSTNGGTGSGATGGNQGSAGGSVTRTVTAEQIAADQKAIDAAQAELVLATQNLDQAALTTPIAGTIASVSVAAGESVSGGSTTKTIVVLGAGQKEVSTTIGIDDVDLVKKGEAVSVTVDGVTAPLAGKVALVGVMNTSGTSGTSTTYPVTVLLNPTPLPLFDGSGASLAIAVGTAANVLTVPTSAVTAIGNRDTVQVDKGGKPTTTFVTLGVQGTDRVQISSGVSAGQRVVLANLSAKIPSSTTTTGRAFGGAGAFTGGGLTGGGLTGGGLTGGGARIGGAGGR